MARMLEMRKFRLLTTTLKLVLTTPYSDRQAWCNVILWALAALAALLGLGLGIFSGGHWWWMNTPTLFLDATMLKWACIGLLRRRAVAAELAEFRRITSEYR